MKIRDIITAIKIGVGVGASLAKGKTAKVLKKTSEATDIVVAVEKLLSKKK